MLFRKGQVSKSMNRVTGFIIANDGTSDNPLWKVRVRDDTSAYNGKKLIVASVHDNIQLAQGLNVTFLIGTIDGEQGQELRAVDVQLQVKRSQGDHR